jgi:hypothetical protein
MPNFPSGHDKSILAPGRRAREAKETSPIY